MLFANSYYVENVTYGTWTYRLTTYDIHSMLAITLITFYGVDVKFGLYEINKNNRANATHGLSPVQKMFQD